MSETPRNLADAFIRDLRGALGDRLTTVALFGSAARGEWIEGVSDVNLLVLVDDIDAPLLALAAPAAQKASERGVRPLVMELAEWRRAADVFSIELADMKEAGETLLGNDPISAPHIQPSILRLQAEREMRAKLLHLHSGMLMSASDPARLGQLLMHALPSFATYMRTALRLAKRPVPASTAEVVDEACRLAAADPAPFQEVLAARAGTKKLEVQLDGKLADHYNTSAEKLAAYIDAHGR